MQRDIDCCGCEFRVDYEWDGEPLAVEGIYIGCNDVTDLLLEKVKEQISEKLYEFYHEDRACAAEYAYEMRAER